MSYQIACSVGIHKILKYRAFGSSILAACFALALAGCGSGYRELASNGLQAGDADPMGKAKLNASQQVDVYFTLGRNAEGQNNIQEAVRMYESVLAKQPKSGEAHWRLAICLDKSGNFDKSDSHYAQAIESAPGNPYIFADYGYSLALKGRYREAEQQLRQAIALKPDLQRAHNNLGIVLAQGSKLEESLQHFRLGGSNVVDAHWNLGQTLIAQSRWDEARGEFQHILALNPDDRNAKTEISGLDRLVAKMERINQSPGNIATPNHAADSGLMRASATVPQTKSNQDSVVRSHHSTR